MEFSYHQKVPHAIQENIIEQVHGKA